MKRFQAIICTGRIWYPCLVAEVLVQRISLKQIHKTLTVTVLGLVDLLDYQGVLTLSVLVLGIWVSQGVLPYVELISCQPKHLKAPEIQCSPEYRAGRLDSEV